MTQTHGGRTDGDAVVTAPRVTRDESEDTMLTTTVRHHATYTSDDGQVLHVWVDDYHDLHIGPALGGWAAITIPVAESIELATAIDDVRTAWDLSDLEDDE